MKILIISFIFVLSGITAYAEDIFTDRDIMDIQVVSVNEEQGNAVVRDLDGNEAEILVDDIISTDGAVVVEINKASITVQSGSTKTKLPVIYGFE